MIIVRNIIAFSDSEKHYQFIFKGKQMMNKSQRTVLALSLATIFSSAAYADDEPIAGRIPLSLDNHAQQAAEEVRKINAQQFSGSLNDKGIATQATDARNDSAFSGNLNIPIDLQVKGYQPEINQSYDLQSNSNYVLPVSGSLNATDWQIDDSYALENGHYLDKVFQQDTDTVLLAENTVTDTATDANSGSLKDENAHSAMPKNMQNISPEERQKMHERMQNQHNAQTATTNGATQLEDITVIGQRDNTPIDRYHNKINRHQIEHSATGNGDIGTMLRSLPNVQFDNTQRTSKNPGEIDPAKISISGGQHYQNSFIVDGMNFNNDLDPTREVGGSWTNLTDPAPGRSQGLALDVDLLDNIKVIDSNADASYGGFTGGVVEVETKKPTKDFAFKISHKYTNGDVKKGFPKSLTKYYLDESDADFGYQRNDYTTYTDTPEFSKNITKISAESVINDEWGIIGQFSRTASRMPTLNNYSAIADPNASAHMRMTPINDENTLTDKVTRTSEAYNFFVKANYDPTPDLGFTFSYTYAPERSRNFMVASKPDQYAVLKSGGHIFGATTDWKNSLGKLKNTLSFSHLENSVDAHGYSNYWLLWQNSATKNWGNYRGAATEGGKAPSERTQFTFSDKIEHEFKEFGNDFITNQIKAGAELSYKDVNFQYNGDYYRSDTTGARPLSEAQKALCIATGDPLCDTAAAYDTAFYGGKKRYGFPDMQQDANGNYIPNDYFEGISNWLNPYTGTTYDIMVWKNGQYLRELRYYKGNEKIKIHSFQPALYLTDDIKMNFKKAGELTLRPGIRLDYDSFMKKTSFAPRFAFDYAFPWNESSSDYATNFIGGANRYYGRNMYAYKLNADMKGLATYVYRLPGSKVEDIVNDPNKQCAGNSSPGNTDNTTECWYNSGSNDTDFSKLKIPYANEFTFGVNQRIKNVNLHAKYIHRDGKDEVVQMRAYQLGLPLKDGYSFNAASNKSGKANSEKYGYGGNPYPTYYVYTNEGRSETDVVSLMVKNVNPFKIWGVKNNFSLAFDWTNVKRNKPDYSSVLSDDDYDDVPVVYDGKVINSSEIPADNFVKPYSIKLGTSHEWRMLGGDWHLSNTLSYKQGHKARYTTTENAADYGVKTPTGDITVYNTMKIDGSYNWDMNLGAEYKVQGNNKLFFNVDVFNLTNRKNVAILNYSKTKQIPTYEMGRSVWLELGYKYY